MARAGRDVPAGFELRFHDIEFARRKLRAERRDRLRALLLRPGILLLRRLRLLLARQILQQLIERCIVRFLLLLLLRRLRLLLRWRWRRRRRRLRLRRLRLRLGRRCRWRRRWWRRRLRL